MASRARNVAARSIHVKIYPTARNLMERREVLRVLERFGEVEMFKSLKYDPANPVPNAFLSIFSSEEAVHAAIEASPIRYRLIADPTGPPPTSSASPTSSSSSSPPMTSPTDAPPQTTTPTESLFELHISPSTYDHRAAIASSPLHGPYTPISPLRSHIASDLSLRIPQSIAKPGLIDWVTGSAAARVSTDGRSGARSGKAGAAAAGSSAGIGNGVGEEQVMTTQQQQQQPRRARGTGLDEINKPWRLRARERAEREKDVPWVMKGLMSRPQTES